jgi:hypothetical protein
MLQLTAAGSSELLVTYKNVELFTIQTERLWLNYIFGKDFVQFTAVYLEIMEFCTF